MNGYVKEKDPNWSINEITSPGSKLVAITPSDGSDLTLYPRSLYVNVAGAVKFLPTLNNDADTVTLNLAAGWHPIQVRKIFATGTTATGIYGVF